MNQTRPQGSLRGRVALVTGAGRGLGRAFARGLADAGAQVVVASRTAAELDALVGEIEAAGGSAISCPTDVTSVGSVQRLVETAVEGYGRLDIVVNNSGIVASTPLLDQDPDEWDRVVSTNLRGTYLVTRAAGAHLTAQGSGKVINIASNFGIKGIANHAAYCASKAGIIAFTRAMALEWARSNVQVNALAPGYFATDLNAELRRDPEMVARVTRAIPARRMGQAEELVPWLLLLAGPESEFMTGEVIVIDGGQVVR